MQNKRQKKTSAISSESGNNITVNTKDIIAIIADVNEAAIDYELERPG